MYVHALGTRVYTVNKEMKFTDYLPLCHAHQKRYQALPAFLYCKRRKAGQGWGTRLCLAGLKSSTMSLTNHSFSNLKTSLHEHSEPLPPENMRYLRTRGTWKQHLWNPFIQWDCITPKQPYSNKTQTTQEWAQISTTHIHTNLYYPTLIEFMPYRSQYPCNCNIRLHRKLCSSQESGYTGMLLHKSPT